MRSLILGLAAVLATLLATSLASAGSRHTGGHVGARVGFNFNFNGGYYARPSALLFVRTVPAYGYADAFAPAPVPVPVPVPPLALNFRDVSGSYGCVGGASNAAQSYGYAGGSFNFSRYDYSNVAAAHAALAERLALEQRLALERESSRQRGFGRRAAPSGNAGSGVVGILSAAARTVRNVAGAVIGGR
jgi:hypothetical protein